MGASPKKVSGEVGHSFSGQIGRVGKFFPVGDEELRCREMGS